MSFHGVPDLDHDIPNTTAPENLPKLRYLFTSVERYLVENNICLTGRSSIKARTQCEDGGAPAAFYIEMEVVSPRPYAVDCIDPNSTPPGHTWSIDWSTAGEICDIQHASAAAINIGNSIPQPHASHEGAMGNIMMLWSPTSPCPSDYTFDRLPSTASNDDAAFSDSEDRLLAIESAAAGNASIRGGTSSAILRQRPSSTMNHDRAPDSQPPVAHHANMINNCRFPPKSRSQTINKLSKGGRITRGRSRSVSVHDDYSGMCVSRARTEAHMLKTAHSILRSDYLEFLEGELPRWAKYGLWDHSTDMIPLIGDATDYYGLQVAYSTVCILEARVNDDVIRSRIALVELHLEYDRASATRQTLNDKRGVGCGVSSSIIDQILQKIHRDWNVLNETERKLRRAKFHDRKRYGKRWAVLADELGKGILILCSPMVAKAVHNTGFTFAMLGALTKAVRANTTSMLILEAIRDVAEQLYHGGSCDSTCGVALLEAARMFDGI
ncbi:uncharacterized protein LMH87_008471 [Akanthomyces muscarius]|uniref:Uncharacterized protein n=1 Tax=Akanthomyces muscarius TaxID=2231603 RepID=A0A9W8QLR3_AKAMU|nr:uncharacterized protein LMH87_008471 [Akanthomyces muscarius]KAJ4159573.1 hypothetical protein LMH87_008471 [Akanthomyces muscarius]